MNLSNVSVHTDEQRSMDQRVTNTGFDLLWPQSVPKYPSRHRQMNVSTLTSMQEPPLMQGELEHASNGPLKQLFGFERNINFCKNQFNERLYSFNLIGLCLFY